MAFTGTCEWLCTRNIDPAVIVRFVYLYCNIVHFGIFGAVFACIFLCCCCYCSVLHLGRCVLLFSFSLMFRLSALHIERAMHAHLFWYLFTTISYSIRMFSFVSLMLLLLLLFLLVLTLEAMVGFNSIQRANNRAGWWKQIACISTHLMKCN